MIPPKYRYSLGKLKSNFATRYGYIDVNTANRGTFVSDENYRASALTEVPAKRKIIFLKDSVYETARIVYYDANQNYLSYNHILKGIYTIRNDAEYYAISYAENDTALNGEYFMAELVEANPHYKELSKKYAKENEQVFFRQSLVGSITMHGNDYDLIYGSSIEDKIIFLIEKYNRGTGAWDSYYTGTFSKTDCRFNTSASRCTLGELSTVDDYVDILNAYDNTYDLIKLAPATTQVSLFKRSCIQIYIAGGSTISAFFNGTYMEEDVDTSVDSDEELRSKYYFALAHTYNEMEASTVDGHSYANGIYTTSGSGWANDSGFTMRLVKVASGGDYWSGNYTKNPIYNITNAEEVDNVITTPGETGGTYFENDTYALRMFDADGSTVIAESNILFYVPSGDIYFSGFDSIQMNITDSISTFQITNILSYKVYQRLLCDVDSVSGVNTYYIPADDFVGSSSNFRKCIGLQDSILGTLVHTQVTVDTPTKYGQNNKGEYFTDNFLPVVTGLTRPLPVCRSTWGNTSIWFCYNAYYTAVIEPTTRKEYTLKDCYNIADVISTLLGQIAPSITHKGTTEYSEFLYSNNTFIKAVDFRVFITPKTNILVSEYDQPAKKAEITLKKLMDMLAQCFQCYWFIENGKFRIEHIRYFKNNKSYSTAPTPSLDLTKLFDRFNKKGVAIYQTEIEYEKSELNKRYEFSWMDSATDIFDGVTIDVKSNYVKADKTESITAEDFSSDIDYMLYNPDEFSEDGFALLCPTLQNGEYILPIVSTSLLDEQGREYDAVVQNWYASWSYLVNLYRYNMPAQQTTVNTRGSMMAIDIIKSMKHSVEFASENDPDEMAIIKTQIGNGTIDEMTINLNTRIVDVDLLYNPI